MTPARPRPVERAQEAQQQTARTRRRHRPTALATAIAQMDYNAPMLTLHGMTRDFHTPVSEQAWLLDGTPLGLAALLLVAGSLADGYGRRLAFLIGTAAMSLTTGLGALATSTLTFTLGRVALGAACASHHQQPRPDRTRLPGRPRTHTCTGHMRRIVQRRHRHWSTDRRRVRRSRLAPGVRGLRRRQPPRGRRCRPCPRRIQSFTRRPARFARRPRVGRGAHHLAQRADTWAERLVARTSGLEATPTRTGQTGKAAFRRATSG